MTATAHRAFFSLVLVAAPAMLAAAVPARAATLPEIRLSPTNAVPRCVTPERLMAFLKQRNPGLAPRFRDIAAHYRHYGQAWRVRWDYAFFQMAIETNFLTYRRPNGRMGDVDPKQNNFAGIGTTGGGVPGDSFPDVKTGVLAQIQHLVVYSGETVAEPVAPRTRLKQEHILAHSRALNRPVRFSDLARRWAADPKYAGSIAWVAERFRAEHCAKGGAPQPNEALPWQQKKPPARTAEAGQAKAAAASSPVRTVWSGGSTPAPVKAPTPVPPPREIVVGATEAPAVPPAAKQADAEAVAASPAVESEAGFALFTPPAGLAAATMPRAADQPVPPPAAEPKADAALPPPPAAPVVAGPPVAPVPEAPAAVAGSAVGGFMIAGSPKPAFVPPSGLGVKPGRCVVETATFGGETTVLVKTTQGADVHYVALSVLDGFEESMTKSFLDSRPEGGAALGTYPTRDAALAQARTLCPD